MIDPRTLMTYGVGALLVLALGAAGTQTVRLANERAAHASTKTTHAQTLQRLADKATVAAHAAVQTQQVQQQALAAIDTQRTQERDHATEENDRLRAAVRAGTVRLRIPAACPARPAGGADLPGAASAAGLDAEAAELAPAAGQAVLDLRAALIAERAQLLALQEYARACSGAKEPNALPNP